MNTQLGEKLNEALINASKSGFTPTPENPYPGITRKDFDLKSDLHKSTFALTKGGQLVLIGDRGIASDGRRISQIHILYFDQVAGEVKDYRVWFGGFRNGHDCKDMGAHRDILCVFPRELFSSTYRRLGDDITKALNPKTTTPQWLATELYADAKHSPSAKDIVDIALPRLIGKQFQRVLVTDPVPPAPEGWENKSVKSRKNKQKEKLLKKTGEVRPEREEQKAEPKEEKKKLQNETPKTVPPMPVAKQSSLTKTTIATVINGKIGGCPVSIEPAKGGRVRLVVGVSVVETTPHTMGRNDLVRLINELNDVVSALDDG